MTIIFLTNMFQKLIPEQRVVTGIIERQLYITAQITSTCIQIHVHMHTCVHARTRTHPHSQTQKDRDRGREKDRERETRIINTVWLYMNASQRFPLSTVSGTVFQVLYQNSLEISMFIQDITCWILHAQHTDGI